MPAQAAGCGARAAPAGGAFPAVRGDGGEYLDPIVFDYDVPARCRHRPVRAPCRTTWAICRRETGRRGQRV